MIILPAAYRQTVVRRARSVVAWFRQSHLRADVVGGAIRPAGQVGAAIDAAAPLDDHSLRAGPAILIESVRESRLADEAQHKGNDDRPAHRHHSTSFRVNSP